MSCYHPLKLFTVGYHKNKNNELVNTNIVRSFDTEYIEINNKKIYEYTKIPCGKCIGCRLDYSRRWANRCLLEMQMHDHSLFLTLTYDDEHLPLKTFSRLDTGETDLQSATLIKKDLQLFVKSLRKAVEPTKIRIFGCGEYGSTTLRPHYHLIVFGLQLDDLVFYRLNQKGFKMYNSPLLDKLWKKGFCVVEECTWETCAYVARYVTKKLNGDAASVYDENGMLPPFVTMSRKPGIGRPFFDAHPEMFDFDKVSVSTVEGGRSFTPPRYFKDLMKTDEDMFLLTDGKKISRELAESLDFLKNTLYSQKYEDALFSEEQNLIAKTNSLTRL